MLQLCYKSDSYKSGDYTQLKAVLTQNILIFALKNRINKPLVGEANHKVYSTHTVPASRVILRGGTAGILPDQII